MKAIEQNRVYFAAPRIFAPAAMPSSLVCAGETVISITSLPGTGVSCTDEDTFVDLNDNTGYTFSGVASARGSWRGRSGNR